jgi:transposase
MEDGRYEIDTNLVESAIRPTAVGKKNWPFIGNPEAGWRSAVFYRLLIAARRCGLDPAKWLGEVLRRIPIAITATPPTNCCRQTESLSPSEPTSPRGH